MRYTLDIPDRLTAVFKQVAKEQEVTQSELMRRALLTYFVLHKEIGLGGSIGVIREGETVKEIVMTF